MYQYPRVTIAFISWNRCHYLRSTIESARVCVDYPNVEWMLSDNDSIEDGLKTYIESLDWFDRILVKTQSHADAMNELIGEATGKYIILWPDDVQFVVRGGWLREIIEIMDSAPDLGSVCLDHMRRSTLETIFNPAVPGHAREWIQEVRRTRGRVRRHRKLHSRNGFALWTMGWMKPGLVGSGIPSLTATDLWRELGPWRGTASRAETGLVDSSLGAESDMLQRIERRLPRLHRAAPVVPVAADIITDPLGCKAKVRGGYRYGVYMPPQEGRFYYRIRSLDELSQTGRTLPVDFGEGVEPVGFRIPVDHRGERKKTDINTSVVFDIEKGAPVPYPLSVTELKDG